MRSRIRGRCEGAGEEGGAGVAKVLCVLYEDPVDGYPGSYARDAIPRIERYYDGQTTPSPERIDFEPGELLGSVSGELGLRRFLETRLLSPRTRTGRTRSSSESCRRLRSSSRSRSGPVT